MDEYARDGRNYLQMNLEKVTDTGLIFILVVYPEETDGLPAAHPERL
jgi:hypothetical protein